MSERLTHIDFKAITLRMSVQLPIKRWLVFSFTAILIAGLSTAQSFAELRSTQKAQPKVSYGKFDRIKYSRSQTQGPRSKQMGLGISSGSTSVVYLDAAPSLWLNMGRRQALQIYMGVKQTSPGLTFGVGGTYKYTLSGNAHSGLHVGGGLGLGTVIDSFFVNFSGVGGIHMFIPGLDHILFNFDAGLTLSVIGGKVQFFASGFSPILGLSVHYLF